MFENKKIGEIPVTDAKTLVGKTVEVSLPELIGETPKGYVMVRFKIDKVDGNNALTRFQGCRVVKEQLYRVVRKRTTKVQVVQDISTKDGWKLHASTIISLNKGANAASRTAVRLAVNEWMKKFGERSGINEFVTAVTSGAAQLNIKKVSGKIFPTRFAEIIKVNVLKTVPPKQ